MPPERADLVLSSDIPNGERDVLVFDGLDVEAYVAGKRMAEKTNAKERNDD